MPMRDRSGEAVGRLVEDPPTVEWPGVTNHGAERYKDRRADDCRLGPRAAWIQSKRVPRPHGLDGDEVRYCEAADVVLIRKDEDLVTAIDVPTAKMPVREAVRTLD